LDPGARTVRKPVGLQFDLGGMGKGWAVDRAADRLHAHRAFLVNAGGDLYAQGQPGDGRGWRIALEHPLHPDRWMAQLFVQDRGLATSSIMKRRWHKAGRLAHHLIDPRTGQPAHTDALSVTVLAPRTVLAEIHAKAALILGAGAGLAYLETLPDVEGLIFTAAGRIAYTAGLAPLIDALEPVGTSFRVSS
jgi:thiamine biosynthesis lipoprotein